MCRLTLNILDARKSIHGETQRGWGEAAVAALSAEPETIEELEAALGRFIESSNRGRLFADYTQGVATGPSSTDTCMIDLAGRLVILPTGDDPLEKHGVVAYWDDQGETDIGVGYHLSEDWQLSQEHAGWRKTSDQRREQRELSPPIDTREVLYGKVAEFVVARCLAERRPGADAAQLVSDIHASWLLTPRDDLRGQAPRDVLLARRGYIDADLWDRCNQWSSLGGCPPGLAETSAAFRFAGFGTHEIVMYYKMVRRLIEDCWDRVARPFEVSVTEELDRLNQLQADWLRAPQADLDKLSPAEVIDRERKRIPLQASAEDLVIDHDCPLCQMMAESTTPAFWHFDGSEMDEGFAFSFHSSREEWEAEQHEWEAMERVWKQEGEESREGKGEVGMVTPASGPWQRSWSSSEGWDELPTSTAVTTMLFSIGGHLAELKVDVSESPESEKFVAVLNQDFGHLTETLREGPHSLVGAVVERFREHLASAAACRPDLSDKCADLEHRLIRLVDRLSENPQSNQSLDA